MPWTFLHGSVLAIATSFAQRLFASLVCLALALPALAGAGEAPRIACPDSVAEGEPFFLRIEAPASTAPLVVHWLDRSLRPEPRSTDTQLELTLLLGLGLRERLSGTRFTLRVEYQTRDGRASMEKSIVRLPKAYPEQHLTVERKYTELSEADLARHEGERLQVRAALGTLSPVRRWTYPLDLPGRGPVTSDFGLRRYFNGDPKTPHGGVDLRAAEGDSVLACAPGRVILAGNHYFAGNSVYLDHGEGLVSMVFHLSRIDVAAGDFVETGQVLGAAGKTGRVTAAHLHWGLSVFGQLVDPLLLVADPPPHVED